MFNVQFSICILHFALAPLAAAAEPLLAVPVDGEPFRAELIGAEADWRLIFRSDGQQRTMPAADLVRWGRCPEQGRGGGLVLADGGLLSADVVAAEGEKLTAKSEPFGKISLPLESLAGVVFHPPAGGQQHDALLDRVLRPGGRSNSPLPLGEGQGVRALLDNGDELAGLLNGIAEGVVKFQTDVGPIEVETDRVVALIFHPIKPRPSVAPADEKNEPLRAWIGLSDGSRLLVARLVIEGGRMTIDSAGRTWKTSSKNLVFLQPLGGRVVYLSDLKPAEYRQTPFVARPPSAVADYPSLAWPWRADRNVTGGQLRSGGQLFPKGIGVHSAAQLVFSPFPLGEGPGVRAKRFQALVGIDESTDGRGSVRFRVLVDGRERYVSPILRGGDPPVPVSVDLTGAKRLELIVDYADRADVLDHADWLDARIVE